MPLKYQVGCLVRPHCTWNHCMALQSQCGWLNLQTNHSLCPIHDGYSSTNHYRWLKYLSGANTSHFLAFEILVIVALILKWIVSTFIVKINEYLRPKLFNECTHISHSFLPCYNLFLSDQNLIVRYQNVSYQTIQISSKL